MGLFSFVPAQAQEMPPCHQMMMEEQQDAQQENCPACEISEDAWGQQLVSPSVVDDVAVVAELVVLSDWRVFIDEYFSEVEEISLPDPPDDVGVRHAELIVKNSTVLVI